MVARTLPIRGRKAHYYVDPRFPERMLSPPDLREMVPSARSDDWAGLQPPKPDVDPVATREKADTNTGTANSGPRREPELPEHFKIVHEKKEPSPEDEFRNLLGDNQEAAARQWQALRRRMGGIARQASMDHHTSRRSCRKLANASKVCRPRSWPPRPSPFASLPWPSLPWMITWFRTS